jgi:hypothetical protein
MPRSRWHRDAHAGGGRGRRRHPRTAITDGRGGPTCCARVTPLSQARMATCWPRCYIDKHLGRAIGCDLRQIVRAGPIRCRPSGYPTCGTTLSNRGGQRDPLTDPPIDVVGPPEQDEHLLAAVRADITRTCNLNPQHRHRACPRVAKRARHNSYRVKRTGGQGLRHAGPATIKLVNLRQLILAACSIYGKWHWVRLLVPPGRLGGRWCTGDPLTA